MRISGVVSFDNKLRKTGTQKSPLKYACAVVDAAEAGRLVGVECGRAGCTDEAK